MNPADWDRYSYVRNSPTRYTDPSGNEPCLEDGYCFEGTYSEDDHVEYQAKQYGIRFKDSMGKWTLAEKLLVLQGVRDAAMALGKLMELDAVHAFRNVWDIFSKGRFVFEKGLCDKCDGAGAYTHSDRHVEFHYLQGFIKETEVYRSAVEAYGSNVHTVVHELGHALANRFKYADPNNPYNMIAKARFNDGKWFTSALGYADSPDPSTVPGYWRPNRATNPQETFANMFVGWTYGAWGNNAYGNQRSNYMNTNMSTWLSP